jgi:uncharacterized protein
MEVRGRFFKVPSQSFFLFGPRGTGKSTWLRHELPEALFVDLLKPEVYREMHARPERLRELVLGSAHPRTVVVDEVQRVPELLNVVHEMMACRSFSTVDTLSVQTPWSNGNGTSTL